MKNTGELVTDSQATISNGDLAELIYQVTPPDQLRGPRFDAVQSKIREMRGTLAHTTADGRQFDKYTLAVEGVLAEIVAGRDPTPRRAYLAARASLPDMLDEELTSQDIIEAIAAKLSRDNLKPEDRPRQLRTLVKRLFAAETAGMPSEIVTSVQRELDLLFARREAGLLGDAVAPGAYCEAVERMSPFRAETARNVARQLESQIGVRRLQEFDTVVGLPVVGFGDQSTLLNASLPELVKQDGRNLYVLVVNVPNSQRPDATAKAAAELARSFNQANKQQIVVVTQSYEPPLALGDLRSAIFDGYMVASNQLTRRSLNNKAFVILDDDFSSMPQDWLEQNRALLSKNPSAQLVAGSLEYDMPDRPLKAFVPELYLGERLRQAISAQLLGSLATATASGREISTTTREMIYRQIFGQAVEGSFFSGMTLRGSAYLAMGGLPSKDEISRTVRQQALIGLLDERSAITVNTSPIVTDARRAVAAYLRDGCPSVWQWKGSYRFQTDAVDPVRVMDVNGVKRIDAGQLAEQLAEVFQFFDPSGTIYSDDQLRRLLTQSGLPANSFRVDSRQPALVKIVQPGLIERGGQ